MVGTSTPTDKFSAKGLIADAISIAAKVIESYLTFAWLNLDEGWNEEKLDNSVCLFNSMSLYISNESI